MTYGIRNVVSILKLRNRKADKAVSEAAEYHMPKGFFGTQNHLLGDWGDTGDNIYNFTIGAHMGHLLDFCAAFLCYFLVYADGSWKQDAKTWQAPWILKILGYNLACEFVICNFWHWFVFRNATNAENLKEFKFNPTNQYEPQGGNVGMLRSSTGNLEREILFTTLGWLQSSFWQVLYTHLWAVGYFAMPDMTQTKSWYWTLFLLWIIAYWREIHFYWAHRGMHPWFARERGLFDGDIGAFLYHHAHSLHHKSYNPGPWSGLCMHPIEHFLYFSSAWLMPVLLPRVHPMVFLYCIFHCNIAPVGGHDGHDDPAGNGDFHWLHHAKFECNYGVPFPVNFDRIFGTWQDYKEFKANGCQMQLGSERAQKEVENAESKRRGLTVSLLQEAAGAQEADPTRPLTLEQVNEHSTKFDCWVALEGRVLDVTKFISHHPGGEKMIIMKAGKDVTQVFNQIHSQGLALLDRFPQQIRQVGKLDN